MNIRSSIDGEEVSGAYVGLSTSWVRPWQRVRSDKNLPGASDFWEGSHSENLALKSPTKQRGWTFAVGHGR